MKRYTTAALLLVTVLAAGCGQKEEEVKNQITIASYDAANTAAEYVKRGDLDAGETVFLTLQSSDVREYAFGVSGLLIEKVYVAEGDVVAKGTLLAEAENSDLKMNVTKAQAEITSINENITHYTGLLETAREKKSDNPDKRKTNLDEISRYELKLAELNDSLVVARQKAAECSKLLAQTQIYAQMDGCIEYVGEYGNGLTSDERMAFVKMGAEDEVFTGTIEGRQEFTAGEEIEIRIGESMYPAEILSVEYVTDSNEDSTESSMEKEDETGNVSTSIQVVTKEYVDLTNVSFAEFVWNEEYLENVLYVPTEAIVTVNGEHYVYVYDEKGFPDPVKIIVGKMGAKYTSIEDGIKEGELVELF